MAHEHVFSSCDGECAIPRVVESFTITACLLEHPLNQPRKVRGRNKQELHIGGDALEYIYIYIHIYACFIGPKALVLATRRK